MDENLINYSPFTHVEFESYNVSAAREVYSQILLDWVQFI